MVSGPRSRLRGGFSFAIRTIPRLRRSLLSPVVGVRASAESWYARSSSGGFDATRRRRRHRARTLLTWTPVPSPPRAFSALATLRRLLMPLV